MFAKQNDLLFSSGDLHGTLSNHFGQVTGKVDAIPKQQLLATSDDTIVESLVEAMRVEPLELLEQHMVLDQHETSVDVSWDRRRSWGRSSDGPVLVPGTRFVVTVPFRGEEMLWSLQPSSWGMNPPRGTVRKPAGDQPGYLELVFEQASDDPADGLKDRINQQLSNIRTYIQNQRPQIESENSRLPDRIREAVNARRARLQTTDKVAASLGIPLRKREGAPDIQPIALQRRRLRPLPPAPKEGYQPEPGITTEDYEYMLNVLRHVGRTFEAAPQTFQLHDEEGLRDILLANLNGHYEGGATGETFRKRGKTDIRIEQQSRAAFVAECKVWRGADSFKEAAAQLLGYLTWRDGKTALIFFNKKVKGFKGVQDKIAEVLPTHPLFLRAKDSGHPGEWRAVFKLQDDGAREITVHIFAFDLFVSPAT